MAETSSQILAWGDCERSGAVDLTEWVFTNNSHQAAVICTSLSHLKRVHQTVVTQRMPRTLSARHVQRTVLTTQISLYKSTKKVII